MYLREGEWCECECSCNSSIGQMEKGLSVHEAATDSNGTWTGEGPSFDKRMNAIESVPLNHLNWYLVTGHPVGSGADGEPLLENVNAKFTVAWDGARFRVTGPVRNFEHTYHTGWPDGCECENIVDQMLRNS